MSIVVYVRCMLLCLAGPCSGLAQRPEIPRVWQDAAIEHLEVPVSQPAYSPEPVFEDYYYRIPVLPIYKSYPVYAPGRAPAGYIKTLKGLKPELAFNAARLRTKEDWIRTGETVFDAPATYGTDVSVGSAEVRNTALSLFTVQWVPAMQRRLEEMSAEEISSAHDAIPPGVFARNRSSPFYPPAVPDLIGVRDRKYLDKTGATVHRSLVDLLRYASMAEGIEFLSSFGGFIPSGDEHFRKLPPPETQERFSDEQLYALGLYLHSLKPPPNLNPIDQAAEAGRKVFGCAGCAGCHPPPVYTNNKLLPASGFKIPEDQVGKYDAQRIGRHPWRTGLMSAGCAMTMCPAVS